MLRLDGKGSLGLQTYRALRRAILGGEYAPGQRLPSTRALAAELGISRTVALVAFDQLLSEGYVEGRLGSGTYVAALLPDLALSVPDAGHPALPSCRTPRLSRFGRRAVAAGEPYVAPRSPDVLIDFRYGFAAPEPDSLGAWRRLLAHAAQRQHLDYAPPEGDARLRRALARHLGRQRGVVCGPEQIVIVGGSQQALDLVARLLLDPGDRVLLEEPHYQGARAVFRAAGAKLVSAPVDAEGLRLPKGARVAARLAYVTPSHQFPTGAVMSLSRRLALLEWAERHDAYVLEDDYDSEYRYEGRPIEAVQGLDGRGRTVYTGTLSKVLFPALRLGFIVAPTGWLPALRSAKWLVDRHTPLLEQVALAEFIESGLYERHLRRMRRRHAARRAALIAALSAELGKHVQVMGTQAGIHVVVWLTGFARARLPTLLDEARRRGVGVQTIDRYYLRPPRRAGLLLGYGDLSERQIREGVRRLAEALRSLDRT